MPSRTRLAVLCALALLLAAVAGWQLSPPADAPALAVAGGAYVPPILTAYDPAPDLARLAARPPFATAQGQPASDVIEAPPAETPATPTAGFRLGGIVMDAAGPEVILVVDGGSLQRLHIGDTVPDGRAIRSITPNTVVLDDPAGPVTLRLFTQGAIAAPAASPVPDGFSSVAPPSALESLPPPGEPSPDMAGHAAPLPNARSVPVPGAPWPPGVPTPPGWNSAAIPRQAPPSRPQYQGRPTTRTD
jgi:hypothetical protein